MYFWLGYVSSVFYGPVNKILACCERDTAFLVSYELGGFSGFIEFFVKNISG